jgi:hypothetical protein
MVWRKLSLRTWHLLLVLRRTVCWAISLDLSYVSVFDNGFPVDDSRLHSLYKFTIFCESHVDETLLCIQRTTLIASIFANFDTSVLLLPLMTHLSTMTPIHFKCMLQWLAITVQEECSLELRCFFHVWHDCCSLIDTHSDCRKRCSTSLRISFRSLRRKCKFTCFGTWNIPRNEWFELHKNCVRSKDWVDFYWSIQSCGRIEHLLHTIDESNALKISGVNSLFRRCCEEKFREDQYQKPSQSIRSYRRKHCEGNENVRRHSWQDKFRCRRWSPCGNASKEPQIKGDSSALLRLWLSRSPCLPFLEGFALSTRFATSLLLDLVSWCLERWCTRRKSHSVEKSP